MSGETDPASEKIKSVYTNASKQLLIFSPPSTLTLHLKRFQQTVSGCRKVNKHVIFPLELDLAPFCSSTCVSMPTVEVGHTAVVYSLYGVVEHAGRLQGGHYTAFVRMRGSGGGSGEMFMTPPPTRSCDIPGLLEEMERQYTKLAQAVRRKQLEDEFSEDEEDVDGVANSKDSCDVKEQTDVGEAKKPVPCRRWFHVSDTNVSEVSEEKVLKCQAYLLFYERTS